MHFPSAIRRRLAFVAGAIALLSCSSRDAGSLHATGAASGQGAASGSIVFTGAANTGLADASCVAEESRAEALPLDIFVLFDESGSMSTPAGSGTRLDAVRAAAADFLRAPESAGIGVGIGYFGNFPIGKTSCNPADYATPAVPIALLPGAVTPLLDSLDTVKPTGETPTGPAIRGACSYVEGWKQAHPANTADILLVTDGVPEAPVSSQFGCTPTLADAVSATTDCVTSTGDALYVLGVGPSLDNLNQIAAAGKSGSAYLVDGTDVQSEVLAALDSIRGTALPCAFTIPAAPSGETLNYGQVNVVATDSSGAEHALYNVDDASACDATRGGWYYDSPDSPRQIELCAASCAFVKAQSNGGAIRFALGCGTLTIPQ
ncbi:MAG TPA: vWA domain-containing protein [Polyangiaceae bacterium]|nr:vWA domain-containing protein [Polyangiaceae bacterium]